MSKQTNYRLSELEKSLLKEFGDELVSHGWTPNQPEMVTFSNSPVGVLDKTQKLALAYIAENEDRIKSAICKNGCVKIEVPAFGGAVALVGDALAAAGGFPFGVGSLANILCLFGLSKFCEDDDLTPEIITIAS